MESELFIWQTFYWQNSGNRNRIHEKEIDEALALGENQGRCLVLFVDYSDRWSTNGHYNQL